MRSEMNKKNNQYESLSDYLEGGLSEEKKRELDQVRSQDALLDQEVRELQLLLKTLHQLPAREPVIDVWPELEPKLLQVQAEERLNVFARAQVRVARFLSNFASGTILFTQAVAMNTEAKMRKYVLHDSLTLGGGG